jgi:hypothetical protein
MNKRQPTDAADLDWLQMEAAMYGPSVTWWAIDLCIKHKEPFPPWIIEYLGQCADRMVHRSGKAKRTIDLREELPRIFDFPKKKPGPGNPLDHRDVVLKPLLKRSFALSFAIRVYRGESPGKAMRNAGDLFLGNVLDDRTLRKYLKEAFQVSRLPTTKQEWEPVIARYIYDAPPPFDRIARAVIPHQPEPTARRSDQRP